MSRQQSIESSFVRILVLGMCVVGSVLWIGCSSSSTSSPTPEGQLVLLEAEPADAAGVVDLKSSIFTGLAPMDGNAVLLGRVVSGQDWETDQATFLVRDLTTDAGDDHDHGGGEASECAFCQAKQNNLESMALVRVVDESGKPFGTDPRKLLGLNEDAVVVAQGSGSIDEDGTLVFDASKVFLRP